MLFFALLFSANCEDIQEEYVIGIDLGTTYSCVGVYVNGQVEIIANHVGSRTTPSWVSFSDTERFVGIEAKNCIVKNPDNTVYNTKRFIGRRWDDEEVQKDLKSYSFRTVSNKGKPVAEVKIKNETKQYSPQEIAAMVVERMKIIADEYLGKPVKKAVITCPAYFNNAQRQATKEAAEIAGLEVVRVLDEPTAAAIAYGMQKRFQTSKYILVYDLGGGTFDVSILQMRDRQFEVKTVNGNTHLGGEDFDDRVVNHFIELWKKKTGLDISKEHKAVQKLRKKVEEAKMALSVAPAIDVIVDALYMGEDFSEKLTRATFETLNIDLFQSTLPPIESVLRDAHLAKEDIDEVVMVGGSSRIPRIRELVKNFFHGKNLSSGINPDEAVAYGAAIQGHLLSKTTKKENGIIVIDRTAHTLGVKTAGGVMSPVIARQTVIPCNRTGLFNPAEDDQERVTISVYEGEEKLTKDNKFLGKFTLWGYQPGKKEDVNIRVTFIFDNDRILNVTAREIKSQKERSIFIDTKELSGEDQEKTKMKREEEIQNEKQNERRVKARDALVYEIRTDRMRLKRLGRKLKESDMMAAEEIMKKAEEYLDMHPEGDVEELGKLQQNVEKIFQSKYRNAVEKNSLPDEV